MVEREVAVAAERVWAVLADPEAWPRWTDSMDEVRLLDGGLSPGSRVRIVQPRLRPGVWTVTELVPGRALTWSSTTPGVVTTATHTVRPVGDGACLLRLGLTQRGPLASVVRLLLGRLVRRYVETEIEGLRAAAEAG